MPLTNRDDKILRILLDRSMEDNENLRDLLAMGKETCNIESKSFDMGISRRILDRVRYFALEGAKAHRSVPLFETYNDSMLLLARFHRDFDAYMLFTEMNRDSKDSFYAPRRKQLRSIVRDMQNLIDDRYDILSISLPPGSGKLQNMCSIVLTPDGYVEMGDIHEGSKVISGTGNVSTVLKTFPHKDKDIFRVTFHDGRSCQCGLEHLWKVQTDKDRLFGTSRVIDTREILDHMSHTRFSVDCLNKDAYEHGRIEYDTCFIDRIEYTGVEDAQCIYIDDPSHLYVTDDYIVTHNTTMGEFFMSFMMGLYPNVPNLMSSHSGFMTRMFYDATLQMITSKEYCWNDVFPDIKFESTNAKEETINLGRWQPFKTLTCRPIRASLTGVTRCEGFLYCDDLVSGIEEALSVERLDKLYGEYTTDLKSRKKNRAKEIHIATRWSVHDVIGRLERQYADNPRAKFVSVPALDPYSGESNFDYEYDVGFSTQYFKDMEQSMDDVSFRCLYLNQPIEREGILYHPDDLIRYFDLPVDAEGKVKEPDAILGCCDTKDTGTDYNFLGVFYQYGDKYYLEDLVFKNIDPGILDQLNSDMLVKHKVQECQFESNKEGSRTANEVERLVKEKGGRCHITKKYTTMNKETKIIVNSSWVKEHIYFKDETTYEKKSDYGVMMSYLCSYSQMGKNKHDDAPDLLAMFAQYVDNLIGGRAEVFDRSELGF